MLTLEMKLSGRTASAAAVTSAAINEHVEISVKKNQYNPAAEDINSE
jgi:hypothetical protein